MARTVAQVVGANVAYFRDLTGKTQSQMGRELAPLIGGQGWSRQAVWKAERGERPFTAAELVALAYVLEVTVPQLFEADPDEPVALSSGHSLIAGAMDALMRGTTPAADRDLRLLASVRRLLRARARLSTVSLGIGAEIVELNAAVQGLPPQTEDRAETQTLMQRIGLAIAAHEREENEKR